MKFIFKTAAVFLIIGLNYSGFFAVGQALAYFFDNEAASGSFSAASLDFSLLDSDWTPVEYKINLDLGNSTLKDVGMINNGTLSFQYTAETNNFSGDTGFCGGLNLTAKLLGKEMYNGSLTGFLSTATSTINTWNYKINMPANFQNSVCSFDFLYNGWQTDMPFYGSGGFSDTEKVGNKISSWGLRINKVYYDVAPDRGVEGDNEWVEIYNQTNVPLDISGWQICDNYSCDTIPAASPIPAEGFAVITGSNTTWGYWSVPSGVVKIVLGGYIGNGLNNDTDELILKRPDGVIIDQMSWGSGGSPDVPEGHMLGRKPNGYDMNQPGDFHDFGPPSLNLIYPDQSGSLFWYWTYAYDIQWIATNPNGNNNDISIDIYWIQDSNHDNIISAGDTMYTIVAGTANDGLYTWQVPSGFLGYIWIKAVARGPENPMLTDAMISGKIYDPFPAEMLQMNPGLVMQAMMEAGMLEAGGEVIKDPGEEIVLDEFMIPNETVISATSSEPVVDEPIADEIIENIPVVTEPATATEQVIEPIEPVEEAVATEIIPEEQTLSEETAVITEEQPIIEEQPVIEEQSVVVEAPIIVDPPAPTE